MTNQTPPDAPDATWGAQRGIYKGPQMTATLDRLKELAAQLPPKLGSDWDGTNHYELTCSGPEGYFWLMVRNFDSDSDTEDGKRMGLLMDIAEEVCRLRDEGILK